MIRIYKQCYILQTTEPLFPFSFRKFLFIFTPFFILADSQYEKASRTQNLNKKKHVDTFDSHFLASLD